MAEKHFAMTLSADQMAVVERALELFFRVRMGQFGEIAQETMMQHISRADYRTRYDAMEQLLLEARKYPFPELKGIGHSYGVGHDVLADRAYNIYQTLRYCRIESERRTGASVPEVCAPPRSVNDETLPPCREVRFTDFAERINHMLPDLHSVPKSAWDLLRECEKKQSAIFNLTGMRLDELIEKFMEGYTLKPPVCVTMQEVSKALENIADGAAAATRAISDLAKTNDAAKAKANAEGGITHEGISE